MLPVTSDASETDVFGMSFNKYPNVFSPIRIGNMEVKNRIQFSPMVSSLSTPTGGVSPELLGYIKYQAQSGVGVITIGSTPIDHINGVDFFGALDPSLFVLIRAESLPNV